MNTIVILIGIGCIIGAIIGGGVKLVQIELSPVTSLWRQLLLGLFGIILVVSGLMAGRGSGGYGPRRGKVSHTPADVLPSAGTGAEALQVPTSGNSGFVIPDSQSRLLTASDLANLSPSQLVIARNEIYARHGRRFKRPDLARYFSSMSWYQPVSDEVALNPVEKANVLLITQYEKARA